MHKAGLYTCLGPASGIKGLFHISLFQQAEYKPWREYQTSNLSRAYNQTNTMPRGNLPCNFAKPGFEAIIEIRKKNYDHGVTF